MAKLSLTYKFLRLIGLHFSETQYGQVSLWTMFVTLLKHYRNAILLKYCMFSVILSPLNYRKLRPVIWRWMGAKVGKDCYIGYEVYIDMTHANLIEVEQGVSIANRCFLLCHQRDLSNYHIGDNYLDLGYNYRKITLKKGCLLGSGVMVTPGVTIGEGAIVGAGSLVTKDIPAWTIAMGSPAKVIKEITER
jgi:acetyltransferase-like isoleucine patch superfamily enzyme